MKRNRNRKKGKGKEKEREDGDEKSMKYIKRDESRLVQFGFEFDYIQTLFIIIMLLSISRGGNDAGHIQHLVRTVHAA